MGSWVHHEHGFSNLAPFSLSTSPLVGLLSTPLLDKETTRQLSLSLSLSLSPPLLDTEKRREGAMEMDGQERIPMERPQKSKKKKNNKDKDKDIDNEATNEVLMERSRQFLAALQELKDLKPQLYSAADYCESSFLFSDQKQAVLDKLKDYTVKALINAVDHIGTVTDKLTDLLSGQIGSQISSAQLRISCLDQRVGLCKEHTDFEGLNQQCIFKYAPKLHKHYILPDEPSCESFKDAIISEEDGNFYGSNLIMQEMKEDQESAYMNEERTLSWILAAQACAKENEIMASQGDSGRTEYYASRAAPFTYQGPNRIPVLRQNNTPKSPEIQLPTLRSMHKQDQNQPLLHSPSKKLSAFLSFNNKNGEARVPPTVVAPSQSKSLLSMISRRRSHKTISYAPAPNKG